jgi:hypothetical protein
MAKPTYTKHKYIYYQKSHWKVGIPIDRDKLCKSYSFEKWGGIDESLICAIKWRDATLKKYGLLDRLEMAKAPDRYSHKDVGIVGVYKTYTNQKNGPFYNWAARYSIGGSAHKACFAINAYGNRAAFQNACAVRYHHAGILIIINRSLIPCLPLVPFKYASKLSRPK